MKTISFLMVACLVSLSVISGTGRSDAGGDGNKYCAKMKDGRLMVMYEGKEMTSDVTLANGTVVKRDGTVVKRDGDRMMLKEGQCVDKDGKMVDKMDKDKKDKDKSDKKDNMSK